MADGAALLNQAHLPFPTLNVDARGEQLLAELRGDSWLHHRLVSAGATCVRIRIVGVSRVIHGFCEEDLPVLHDNGDDVDDGAYWFRITASFEPMARPAKLAAYRATMIQHLPL